MDMSMSIAKDSMNMAKVNLATQVQTSVAKTAMDVYKQSAEDLLKSMGIGQNMNVSG